jgi:hypothetical protein
MLNAYYNHVRAFENTLVTKYYGLHCVKLTGPAQKKVQRQQQNQYTISVIEMLNVMSDLGTLHHHGEPLLLRLCDSQTI